MVEFEAGSREDFQGNCGSHIWLTREWSWPRARGWWGCPQGDLACHAGGLPWRTCHTENLTVISDREWVRRLLSKD